MKRIALLVILLAPGGLLAAGCSNQKPEERKLPPGPAPTTSPTPMPGPASAGSAKPEAQGTGFASFDEALAGRKPWVAPEDKAGIVELIAVDDLSGQTKGKFTVERRCGAEATKVVETLGKRIAERAKSGHEAPTCKEDGGVMTCAQPGIAEGDIRIELQYGKIGEAWRVIGARTYGVGVTVPKEDAKYAALLKETCK